MDLTAKLNNVIDMAIAYAPRIVMAIITLIIGLWIIGRVMKFIRQGLVKAGLGEDLVPFLSSLISVLLKVMLLFSIAGIVGIETTSFVAVLAAAGFAIGMALQGSLANFAAGVMVLIFKPYKVGDLVSVQDQLGHVEEVQIFNTIMKSLDNKKVIVPNGQAISGVITNLSTEGVLRVDLEVQVGYAEDFPKVQQVIYDAIAKTPKVLRDPAPYVGILSFESHNVKIAVRPYATTADYWDVYFETYKNVKSALSEAGVQMAYAEGLSLGPIGK